MFKKSLYILIVFCFINCQIETYAAYDANSLIKKEEINLTVLTYFCDHITGRPMSLKVYVDGGTPDYSLYADGLVVGQISENEFVILGLLCGEGVDLTITDALGNTADFWAEAFVMPTPGAEAGLDKVISCFNDLAILDGSSGIENVAYSWTGPDPEFENNSQNPGVGVPGEYHLTVIKHGQWLSLL